MVLYVDWMDGWMGWVKYRAPVLIAESLEKSKFGGTGFPKRGELRFGMVFECLMQKTTDFLVWETG